MVRIDIVIGENKSGIMMTSNGKRNVLLSHSIVPEEVLLEAIKKTRSKSLRIHADEPKIRNIIMANYGTYKSNSETDKLIIAELTTRFAEIRPASQPNVDILNAAINKNEKGEAEDDLPHQENESSTEYNIPNIPEEISFDIQDEDVCNKSILRAAVDDEDPYDL